MLYLCLVDGKPVHKWSLDTKADGLEVLGQPILDDEGHIADSAWLTIVDGKVAFDKALKNQAKAKEKADDEAKRQKREAMKALKDKPNKSLKELEDLVNYLADVL
jgi:type II restriction/modification system DNA methylase subunit YeeA